MRPIPSPASGEAYELLKKAKSLLEKAEKLDMVEHEGKKIPAFAADGKGAKDETKKGSGKCPSCGEKLEKGMCMKMGCMGKASVDMKKGSQHKIQTFNTNPETTQFMIETGGTTYHQQYSTNNSLLDSMMSPCARCSANAYEGCKLPGHEGMSLSECAQYAPMMR